MKQNKIYWGKTLCSFLMVLLLIPIGHALMILMESYLQPTTIHYCAFFMGFCGLVTALIGVFVTGGTKQTLFGIFGAMLFWTGWIEFLIAYYAERYGTQCDLSGSGIVQATTEYINGIAVSHDFTINGQPIESFDRATLKALRGSRAEYLTMPGTFGMWMLFVVFYLFRTHTGLKFLHWFQKLIGSKKPINITPMPYFPSIAVLMEWNIMMWGAYLLLMFCYDPVFLGESHPVTFTVAGIALIGSIIVFIRQLRVSDWGKNIRMSLATVIIFWTFVEVLARNGIFKEIWVAPQQYAVEMWVILGALIITISIAIYQSRKK